MEVETFETTEITDYGIENNEEQIKLIEELGLTGQQSLLDGSKTGICPYPLMTNEERFVYRVLFHKITKVDEYKGDAIPLRLLQIIAHSKQIEDITKLYILSEPHVDIDDRVLIGVTDNFYDWESFTSNNF